MNVQKKKDINASQLTKLEKKMKAMAVLETFSHSKLA